MGINGDELEHVCQEQKVFTVQKEKLGGWKNSLLMGEEAVSIE